jgi:hypothetical protein
MSGVTVIRGSDPGALDQLRSGAGPVVLVSDGVDETRATDLAAALRASGRVAIEVRSGGWDGASHSILSAACNGVVSGFGERGIEAAIAHLQHVEYGAGRE